MTLRLAEPSDIPQILEVCKKFKGLSPYAKLETSEERIIAAISSVIDSDKEQAVLILAEEDDKIVGLISGVVTQLLFSEQKVAGEIAWWVDPDYRNKSVGIELSEALEFWATKIGCELITLSFLGEGDLDKVTKKYEEQGYRLIERSYLKELN